jgi:polyhydroxyalkanoate synthase
MSSNPFALDPDAVAREFREFNRRLGEGLRLLPSFGAPAPGASARDAVYQEDLITLYRYRPRTGQRGAIPVLIVYALVNRPEVLDLQEGRSVIEGLLDAGLDVWLIDWGYPHEVDNVLTLDDYVNGYLDACIDRVRESVDGAAPNLLGICQGGTLSLCYAALHPDKVRNLVLTVTPVDFQTEADRLSRLVRHIDIGRLVEAFGNVPGAMLTWVFLMQKPFRLMSQKYVDLLETFDDPEKVQNFLRMEHWIFNSPDQAGAAFGQFVRQFYQENRLLRGGVVIGDQPVDLRCVSAPILNIYARDDHLVPPSASRALNGLTGTDDYSELEFPGGHIGIYVSRGAQQTLPPAIGRWLAART